MSSLQYELVFNNLLPKAAFEKLDQSSLKGRTLSVRADKTAQQQDTANSKRRKTDADAAAADAKTTAPAARKDRVDSSAADASKDRPKGSRNTTKGGERERRKRRGRERERARERKRKREREREGERQSRRPQETLKLASLPAKYVPMTGDVLVQGGWFLHFSRTRGQRVLVAPSGDMLPVDVLRVALSA